MFKILLSMLHTKNLRTRDETKDHKFRNGLLIMGSLYVILGIMLGLYVFFRIFSGMSAFIKAAFALVIIAHIAGYVLLGVITRPRKRK